MTPIQPLQVIPRSEPVSYILRHLILGTALGVTATAAFMWPDPDAKRIERIIARIGDHVCQGRLGFVAITKLTDRRFRFECGSGVVIEHDMVIR